ncbi:MAG: pantoate--beta-alanine ligase, partial [bacterium]|nr:pantoate--beta-alanine ligase [bacterium]
TQFSPDEDFDKYPKQVEKDILLLKKMGVHLLFTPESSNMYTEKKETSTIVDIPYLSNLLCGQSRPVLFQGVCTVVCKLFNIVTPDKAFFGEKDFQQLVIIKKITRDLFFPVEIVACKTAREKDGLALSSRNIYLSESERKIAPEIYKTLLSGQHMFQSGIIESEKLLSEMQKNLINNTPVKIDYLDIIDQKTLERKKIAEQKNRIIFAGFLGNTRLIDNIKL